MSQRAALAAATLGGVVTLAPAGVAGAVDFQSFKHPSKPIYCAYFGGQKASELRCDLLYLNDRAVVLSTKGRARMIKVTDTVAGPNARALAIGTPRRFGVFTCTARKASLRCRDRATGHGFNVGPSVTKLY